jgi:hypothetical protein
MDLKIIFIDNGCIIFKKLRWKRIAILWGTLFVAQIFLILLGSLYIKSNSIFTNLSKRKFFYYSFKIIYVSLKCDKIYNFFPHICFKNLCNSLCPPSVWNFLTEIRRCIYIWNEIKLTIHYYKKNIFWIFVW